MESKSTRARFLAADDLPTLFSAIEALPFKVEFKSLNPAPDGGWVQTFILPDHVDWQSVDLRGI